MNYLAVIVVSIAVYILQSIWYSVLFGNAWRRLSGIREMRPTAMTIIVGIIQVIILNAVLAMFVGYTLSGTFLQGMLVGFFVWLGFIAMTHLNSVIYERKPFALYMINMVQMLITLVIAGGIFAVWI